MAPSESGAVSIPAPAGRGAVRTPARAQKRDSGARARRIGARSLALGYLGVLLVAPLVMIFYRTFEHGLGPVWDAVMASNAQHAFWLSLEIVAIAVPLNTVFGIGVALLLERGKFRGKALLSLIIDLPFAISPVVVGLALVLVYGKRAGSATP
jgi:sulfate transport system permease protein